VGSGDKKERSGEKTRAGGLSDDSFIFPFYPRQTSEFIPGAVRLPAQLALLPLQG